ncbi:MAG: hypothetical protein WEA58_05610 [Balneolaceae bacterium]
MENSTENKSEEWIVFGCFFATFGALSLIPPGRDFILNYVDLHTSALVSMILAFAGVGCFIIHYFKK